ncbi:MAG: response regulator, partial [Candidatus Zixiibacteriota bacterium]
MRLPFPFENANIRPRRRATTIRTHEGAITLAQILIIEDEELLAKSLARYLTGREHECIIAGSAEEGLKSLERMQMDLILLDLQLPGMSGIDAIKKLREQDPNLVVIITTAHGTMAAAVDAMRFGASDFLRKPLDM